MQREEVLINGRPATPEAWAAWEEAIGLGPKSRARKKAAHEHVRQLAEQLKQQAEERDARRD